MDLVNVSRDIFYYDEPGSENSKYTDSGFELSLNKL